MELTLLVYFPPFFFFIFDICRSMAETIIRENLGKLLYFVKIKKRKKRNFNFFLVEKFENKNFQLEEKVIYIRGMRFIINIQSMRNPKFKES